VQRCPTAALPAPEFSVALKNIHLTAKTKLIINHRHHLVVVIITESLNVA